MDKKIEIKNNLGSCRIKVNKMLSTLNTNWNIFIPKYTLSNRNEAKYLSHLNKTKELSKKVHNKINNIKNINIKKKSNKTTINTTEENYVKQPIDFIINHGVLVYQRNFKGEEIVNLGVNNEYLRKNKFNMVKNDNSIYQSQSNFGLIDPNSTVNSNLSHTKKPNSSNWRKNIISMSDMAKSKNKNKNTSSRQKNMFNTNLNTTQNSINSMNSVSVKNCFVSSKNKTLTNNRDKQRSNLEIKNAKKVINYVRKKKNVNDSNKFLIFKKKKNVTSFFSNDENQCMNNKCNINNKTKVKNKNDNKIIPKVLETRFNSTFMKTTNTKEESNINNIIKKLNKNKDNIQKKEKKKLKNENFEKLIEKMNILVNYYLKKYFHILLKYNISENNNNKILNDNDDNVKIDIEEIAHDTNNKKRFSQENRKIEIDINNIEIVKNRQKLKIKNSFDLPDNKKSNSIIVNKMISSNTSSCKELPKNFRKNNNLSFLLTNKLKFFSKDKESNNNINDTRESELYRDSQSLQKKYEQICRRKKRDMTLTFTRKFKDKDINSVLENNYLSDFNKTNSFSNFNDNTSINSMNINNLDHRKKYNKIFYKESPLNTSYNNKNIENENDYTKDKKMIKIKLIKSNNIKHKKMIKYRIEKFIPKAMSKDIQDNINIHNLSEIRKKKTMNISDNNDDKTLPRKKSYASFNNKIINDYLSENNISSTNDINKTYNNKLDKKTFTHKRKSLVGNKNNLKIKEIYNKKGKAKNKNKTKNKKKNKSDSNSNNKIMYISHLIKNICTKDKRIFIHINYITQILKSKYNRYNNSMLLYTNIMNYNYIGLHQRNKNVLKRNNDYENKLSLIKEEDEKSKCLNSTNSIKFIDEDELYNNPKANMKHIRILKDRYGYNLSVPKILNIIEKSYLNKCSEDKRDFLLKLKIINFNSIIKRIFYKKLRFTKFGKLLQKKGKNKFIYYPKINKPKMNTKVHQMSNIYSKSKIDNDRNELTSRSLDINKDYKTIELSGIKDTIYCRNNFTDRDVILQLLSKTEIKKGFKNE